MSDPISFGVGWEAHAGYVFRLSISNDGSPFFTVRARGGTQVLAIAVTLPELEAITAVFKKAVMAGQHGEDDRSLDEQLAKLPKVNP